MTLPDLIAQLRAAAQGTSAGPWGVEGKDDKGQSVIANEHIELATLWHHSVGAIEKEMEANAAYIVAAQPQNILCLLDAYAEMERAITEAAADVLAERRRQVAQEGWTPEHDDKQPGRMARAAACYASHAGGCLGWSPGAYRQADPPHTSEAEVLWPWDWDWWEPKCPRRDLVRAAALILAEIERLDRAALQQKDKADE